MLLSLKKPFFKKAIQRGNKKPQQINQNNEKYSNNPKKTMKEKQRNKSQRK